MADTDPGSESQGQGQGQGGLVDDFDIDFNAPAAEPTGGTGTSTTSGDGGTPAPAPVAAPGEGAQPQDPNAFPADLTAAMARERLTPMPGETPLQAYQRLSFHQERKAAQFYKEKKEAERARMAEISELRAGLEPMLRDYYQRQRMAALEEAEAQIPPKDSPEYQVWLQEELLRRDDERRQQEWELAQQYQQQQLEAQNQGQLGMIDEAGYTKVAEGLGQVPGVQPDPEFAHAYDVYSESAIAAARGYFPEANDEQIMEFVALSQKLDIRKAEMNGVDIRQVMKQRLNGMIESLVRRGLVTRNGQGQGQGQPAPASAAGNGNGNGQPKSPAPAQGQQPQKTVAQRVTADAQAAARRAPTTVPGSSRPTTLPGQLPDPSSFEDDDAYVEAALAGLLGNEEQRAMPHKKVR